MSRSSLAIEAGYKAGKRSKVILFLRHRDFVFQAEDSIKNPVKFGVVEENYFMKFLDVNIGDFVIRISRDKKHDKSIFIRSINYSGVMEVPSSAEENQELIKACKAFAKQGDEVKETSKGKESFYYLK